MHRHTKDRICETNAAFPYLAEKGMDVLTFKNFNRLSGFGKFWKSLFWIIYAPFLVMGKGYDVVYCDDSYPFYPALVKLASPKSKVIIRLGDFHLMYYYSGFVYKILHYIEKICWGMVDGIIAISWDMANLIRKETGLKVDIALDPVDLKEFLPLKSTYNPETMFPIVMTHGVLTKNKNVDLVLEAARFLPDVRFWIIGDGPDRKRLEADKPRNVWFFGWRFMDRIKYYIKDCNVGLALRSDNPGNDYVVTSPFLQYGSMGKPCLVTRRKVFGDYEWQFSGVDEMVEKLKVLLGHPEEGEKLREYVIKNHDAEKIAGEIWGILNN